VLQLAANCNQFCLRSLWGKSFSLPHISINLQVFLRAFPFSTFFHRSGAWRTFQLDNVIRRRADAATPTCHNLAEENELNDKSLEQNVRHQKSRHLSWTENMPNTHRSNWSRSLNHHRETRVVLVVVHYHRRTTWPHSNRTLCLLIIMTMPSTARFSQECHRSNSHYEQNSNSHNGDCCPRSNHLALLIHWEKPVFHQCEEKVFNDLYLL